MDNRFSARPWSNRELRNVLRFLPDIKSVINVSGWMDQDKEGNTYRSYFADAVSYRITNYVVDKGHGAQGDGVIPLDLMKPVPPELCGAADTVLFHTVLEHVADPFAVFSRVCEISTDLVITVVPFRQLLHFEPLYYGDYFRFTPFSMRAMHESNGLKILYESYTPPPADDVYLLYVGSKHAERHAAFPVRLEELASLNGRMGNASLLLKLRTAIGLR